MRRSFASIYTFRSNVHTIQMVYRRGWIVVLDLLEVISVLLLAPAYSLPSLVQTQLFHSHPLNFFHSKPENVSVQEKISDRGAFSDGTWYLISNFWQNQIEIFLLSFIFRKIAFVRASLCKLNFTFF